MDRQIADGITNKIIGKYNKVYAGGSSHPGPNIYNFATTPYHAYFINRELFSDYMCTITVYADRIEMGWNGTPKETFSLLDPGCFKNCRKFFKKLKKR